MPTTESYFGPQGSLKRAEAKFNASAKTPLAYCRYARVCFMAAEQVLYDVRRFRFSGLRYIFAGVCTAGYAVELIDESGMGTTDIDRDRVPEWAAALDICCLIYRRFGWLDFGRRENMTLYYRGNIHVMLRDWFGVIPAEVRASLLLHEIYLDGMVDQEKMDYVKQSCEYLFKHNQKPLATARIARQLATLSPKQRRYYNSLADAAIAS